MFRGLGAPVARQLEDVVLPTPDIVHDVAHDLDLGGRLVQLRAVGRAHSRGDQVVTVPDAGVLLTGDLVEAGQFPIFPWFRRTTRTCPAPGGSRSWNAWWRRRREWSSPATARSVARTCRGTSATT